MPAEKARLLGQLKGRMRAQHLSPRTERVYAGSVIRFIRYHGMRHPTELGDRVRDAGIAKQATCHALRNAFATHLLKTRLGGD
jgi:hypothetical protein